MDITLLNFSWNKKNPFFLSKTKNTFTKKLENTDLKNSVPPLRPKFYYHFSIYPCSFSYQLSLIFIFYKTWITLIFYNSS